MAVANDLDLSYCLELKTLSEVIGELCNLQVLNVKGCKNLRKMPQGITSLINLRHLLVNVDKRGISEYLTSLPKRVGKLTSLRTLSNFIVCDGDTKDACKIEELGNLKELRGELRITGMHRVEDAGEVRKAKLKNLKHLHRFVLDFQSNNRGIVKLIREVAEAVQPHPNLKSLCIYCYEADEWPRWMMDSSLLQLTVLVLNGCSYSKCLPPLGKLPHLERLDVYEMLRLKYVGAEFLGSSSSSSSEIAFPKLKHLYFEGMLEWENWELKEEQGRKVMPCLLSLKICLSPKLSTLPDLLLERQPPLDIIIWGCPLLEDLSRHRL